MPRLTTYLSQPPGANNRLARSGAPSVANAVLGQIADGLDQVGDRPADPVEIGHHEGCSPSGGRRGRHLIAVLWPVSR